MEHSRFMMSIETWGFSYVDTYIIFIGIPVNTALCSCIYFIYQCDMDLSLRGPLDGQEASVYKTS
jgi:hypothetical protein